MLTKNGKTLRRADAVGICFHRNHVLRELSGNDARKKNKYQSACEGSYRKLPWSSLVEDHLGYSQSVFPIPKTFRPAGHCTGAQLMQRAHGGAMLDTLRCWE
jgi:hypothetical protein